MWQSRQVLEGYETFDDAGIFLINDETALVQTLDFFTPVVDDPAAFGRIATANALSDVYAMGGKPLTAMNILAVPIEDLSHDRLHALLQGSADTLREAECSLVGGHTIQDKELKFGCSITGVVHPKKFWSNATARPGDALILTKPLGTGVLASAHKADKIGADVVARMIECMGALNRGACEAAIRVGGISAATDITGFGLAGHGGSMGRASKATLRIDVAKAPRFEEALHLIRQNFKTRGDKQNREYIAGHYDVAPGVPKDLEDLMFDPQTSGGLLLAVAADKADALVRELKQAKTLAAALIGEVLPRQGELYLKLA